MAMAAFSVLSRYLRMARRPGGRRRRFGGDEDGAVLVETIIILPVMIVFLVGILEFGALLYNKIQVETGLKDAARYVARCPAVSGLGSTCDNDDFIAARNLALSGSLNGGNPRVPGWNIDDITITTDPDPIAVDGVVQVSTSFNYPGGPLLGLINLDFIPVTAFHQERVIGW